MADITVTIVPLGQRTDAIDCSECGVLPLMPHEDISDFVHNHLFGVHHCNPDSVEIRNV